MRLGILLKPDAEMIEIADGERILVNHAWQAGPEELYESAVKRMAHDQTPFGCIEVPWHGEITQAPDHDWETETREQVGGTRCIPGGNVLELIKIEPVE